MDSKSLVLVDCGSGWTRVECFSEHQDGLVYNDSAAKLPQRPIADILAENEEKVLEQWLDTFATMLPEKYGRIVVGCTAGVRDAISEGKVVSAQVDSFKALLQNRFEDADVLVVGGEDEARYEYLAARYCFRQLIDSGDHKLDIREDEIGIFSSGGMSSQVVFPNSDGLCNLSLETKTKIWNKCFLEHGIETGIERENAHLSSVCKAVMDANDNKLLRGTFVAIEMFGAVGERAGIGQRLVSVQEAKQSIEQHLEDWKSVVNQATAEERKAWDWRTVVAGTSAVQALRVLELTDPSARIFFSRKFALGPSHELKPSWGLGMYLACHGNTYREMLANVQT